MAKKRVTRERLIQRLSYDLRTGVFKWRERPRRRACSEIAGTLTDMGYRLICIDQVIHKAHRLAWVYVHGTWPRGQIDHINGDRDDNRIANLREANFSQNQANSKVRVNNKSGYKGVYFCKSNKAWVARITVNYRTITLGYFKTAELAHKAYVAASIKYFGEYARAA